MKKYGDGFKAKVIHVIVKAQTVHSERHLPKPMYLCFYEL